MNRAPMNPKFFLNKWYPPRSVPVLTSPRPSHPLASFYPTPFLCSAVARTSSSSSHPTRSTRCHPEEAPVTIAATHGPGQRDGRGWGIVVIIIQMRRAKLELCPSPSGWLTVTNSSLIHPNHQLYTGQRRPERQEEAQSASQWQRRGSAQHSAQRSSSVSSFCLRDSRRQPVIMPVAVAALHGRLASCYVAEVRADPPCCDDEGMQTQEQAQFSITYTLHPFQEQKWCQYLYYQLQSDQLEKENEQSKTELTDSPHQSC